MVVAPPAAEPLEPAAVVVRLEQQVAELERQLAVEQLMRQGVEGERITTPPGLPSRLRDEKQLLATFSTALKAAGFDGQVSSIDCTEHPCIVYGTGFGERGDLDKLKGHLGPYQDDSFSVFGFGSSDGKKEHRFFGVAVLPGSSERPDEVTQKRLTFRINQMREVSQPAKP